jgi:ribosomal-protein-alanine N-acetyltransferase
MIAVVAGESAEILAKIHAAAFDHPWDAAALRALIDAPGVCALAADAGFVLVRVAVDEAEILTLAVKPEGRRQGWGRRLVEAGAKKAQAAGATRLFLEVAADNVAAIALYERLNFHAVGRRNGYYKRACGPPVDALVLHKALNLSA